MKQKQKKNSSGNLEAEVEKYIIRNKRKTDDQFIKFQIDKNNIITFISGTIQRRPLRNNVKCRVYPSLYCPHKYMHDEANKI